MVLSEGVTQLTTFTGPRQRSTLLKPQRTFAPSNLRVVAPIVKQQPVQVTARAYGTIFTLVSQAEGGHAVLWP